MTTPDNVRYAHDIIDDIANGYTPNSYDLNLLRGFLPEKPQQKTLGELVEEVKQVWGATVSNTWPEDTHGELDGWLWEFHTQLEGLEKTQDKNPQADPSQASQASPRLPEGMLLATHPINGLCVVSPNTDYEGDRRIFYLSGNVLAGADSRWVPSDVLTFLDAETPHPEFLGGEGASPEFLETETDYKIAPTGTIVVYKKCIPWVKWGGTWRTLAADEQNSPSEMSVLRRFVLRWGYGNE